MYTRLVDESTRKNCIEPINVFNPSEEGEEWFCPFCAPKSAVYSLSIPKSQDEQGLLEIKKLIKEHMELHKQDLLDQLNLDGNEYEKSKVESMKRVRLWITGTINDRRLYEKDPL